MMYNILISSNSFGYGQNKEVLEKEFYSKNLKHYFLNLKEANDEILNEIDGLIVGTSEVTPTIIDRMNKLKCIVKFGIGTDNIDINYAQKKGIIVKNMPNINSDAVAEFTIGMIFAIARKIPQGYLNLQNGNFLKEMGTRVTDKVVGVIGTGNIGKKVARLCKGLEMLVQVYDVYPDDTWSLENDINYVTLEYLLETSDFVTIHIPLTSETRNIIGKREISLMKNSAYLLNMARGGIIDEEALYEALVSEKIKGAAVDVFLEEPPKNNPLIHLKNVVATPHMAACEEETLRKMDKKCIEILSDCLKNANV